MRLELTTNGSTQARYFCWAPSPCTIRVVDAEGAVAAPTVTVRNVPSGPAAGVVDFRAARDSAPVETLTMSVPLDGTPVGFFAAGRPGRASTDNGDTALQLEIAGAVVQTVPAMVRIRKDANTLTPAERDRFLSALARLNGAGQGPFAVIREMHRLDGYWEAHANRGFLPWHRAYLLDLERRLQLVDPGVTLPYWRFDRPAPALFSADFIGVSDANDNVMFSPQNPLQGWVRDNGTLGVVRRPEFDTVYGAPAVRDDAATLAIGTNYRSFSDRDTGVEMDPHNWAHSAFGGLLADPSTAPTDPLFFLLHTNVDRLWARWQAQNWIERAEPDAATSYYDGTRVGHRRGESMWPWNGATGAGGRLDRPATAPGGGLPAGDSARRPTPAPLVRDVIDYGGRFDALGGLGYDYDDVS